MKKLLFVLLLLFNTCTAAPVGDVTSMSISQFVYRYNEISYDVDIGDFKIWHRTSGQDVYKCYFAYSDARMYICSINGRIQQLLFVSKLTSQTGIEESVKKVAVSLKALGIDNVEDAITSALNDSNGIATAWSEQEGQVIELAVDDTETELNFHIIKK